MEINPDKQAHVQIAWLEVEVVHVHAHVRAHHTSQEDFFRGSHHVNVSSGDNNVVNMLEQVRPSTADLGSVHRRLSCKLLSGYTAPPSG